jgi:hypothetical protein
MTEQNANTSTVPSAEEAPAATSTVHVWMSDGAEGWAATLPEWTEQAARAAAFEAAGNYEDPGAREILALSVELCEDGQGTGETFDFDLEIGNDPDEPDCAEGEDHDWESPFSIVGGCESNPGCWSIGGTQTKTREVCSICGAYRVTTSESTRGSYPRTPERVEYEEADEASRKHAASKDRVASWETVAVAVVTYPDGDSEGACDEEVQVGEDKITGRWFVRTQDDAGGSDDGPDGSFADEEAATAEAEELAVGLDEGDGQETAVEYLARKAEEAEEEAQDEDGEWLVRLPGGEEIRYSTEESAKAKEASWYEQVRAANPGTDILFNCMECPEVVHLVDLCDFCNGHGLKTPGAPSRGPVVSEICGTLPRQPRPLRICEACWTDGCNETERQAILVGCAPRNLTKCSFCGCWMDGSLHRSDEPADCCETCLVAYLDGVEDGEAWDLSGYADHAAVVADREGWDEATINACGSTECRRVWEVEEGDDEAWGAACSAYNAGAYAGATKPQEERSGREPEGGRLEDDLDSLDPETGEVR